VEPTTPHHAAFAALPPPLAERILYKAFVAGGRSVAAREQLSRVCKCELTPAVLTLLWPGAGQSPGWIDFAHHFQLETTS